MHARPLALSVCIAPAGACETDRTSHLRKRIGQAQPTKMTSSRRGCWRAGTARHRRASPTMGGGKGHFVYRRCVHKKELIGGSIASGQSLCGSATQSVLKIGAFFVDSIDIEISYKAPSAVVGTFDPPRRILDLKISIRPDGDLGSVRSEGGYSGTPRSIRVKLVSQRTQGQLFASCPGAGLAARAPDRSRSNENRFEFEIRWEPSSLETRARSFRRRGPRCIDPPS